MRDAGAAVVGADGEPLVAEPAISATMSAAMTRLVYAALRRRRAARDESP